MSGTSRLVERFREKGNAARQAKADFYNAFRKGVRKRDPQEYQRLLSRYKMETQSALPAGWPEDLNEIDAGHANAIETAIAFLMADPYFNNSGYAKKEIIRRLKRAPLTVKQRRELAGVVIARIHGDDRREIGAYGKLAAALHLPGLDAEVNELTKHDNKDIARRACWIMLRIASRRHKSEWPQE